VWATGFTTDAISFLPEKCVKRGRVCVNNFLQTTDFPNLYAIGDIAQTTDPKNPQIIYPQLGEAAHKEGIYAAKHILATLKGQTIAPFHFVSKAMLMPVGQWYGVAIFSPRIILFGKFAWWLRRTAYVLFLPGFLRKVRLIVDWTLASFGFRHIIDLNMEEEHKM
jgi:NADH dehydrogenase